MADFPMALSYAPGGGVILTGSLGCPATDFLWVEGLAVGGRNWPNANTAFYIPFTVEISVTAYQMGFEVTGTGGNCNVGIYDINGVRLVVSGSTAVGGAGFQGIDITDTPLAPGVYFMAMVVDSITPAFRGYIVGSVASYSVQGIQDEDSAFALPATATMTALATSFLPVLGVALKSTF